MGTRADFYVGRGDNAEWIGSITWDGYPDGIAEAVFDTVSEDGYRKAVEAFFADRTDVTHPSEPWPWPWDDSRTTDYAYAFDGNRVYGSSFGHTWFIVDPSRENHGEPATGVKDAVFPNMASRKGSLDQCQRRRLMITAPGIYDGMPPEEYHADPVPGGSLSSGGARKLVPPSCPAKFRWWEQHEAPKAAHFDLGHAAHKLVLGVGPDIVEVEANDWRTKAAKETRVLVHAENKVPLLTKDFEYVTEMADALAAHPVAGQLFQPGTGDAEQSAFWWDKVFGIWRRARYDWLPHNKSGQRLIVPDYKTCVSAEPAALSKAMAQHGYDQQAAWYVDGVRALRLAEEVVFLFVFQEKTPPYVVTICQPDVVAMRRGRDRNNLAMATYAECKAYDRWPAYADEVINLPLPVWTENEYESEKEQGEYDVKGGELGWRSMSRQAR